MLALNYFTSSSHYQIEGRYESGSRDYYIGNYIECDATHRVVRMAQSGCGYTAVVEEHHFASFEDALAFVNNRLASSPVAGGW